MIVSTESFSPPFFKDPDSLEFQLLSQVNPFRLSTRQLEKKLINHLITKLLSRPLYEVVTKVCTGGLMYTNTSASLPSQNVSCACACARLMSYACHLYKHVPFRRGDALVRCGEGQFFLGFPRSSKFEAAAWDGNEHRGTYYGLSPQTGAYKTGKMSANIGEAARVATASLELDLLG
jgi:hypothetical protein